jgi:hypothetical protein
MQRTACSRQRAIDDMRQATGSRQRACKRHRAADNVQPTDLSVEARPMAEACVREAVCPPGTHLRLLLGGRLLRNNNDASARAGARACVGVGVRVSVLLARVLHTEGEKTSENS